MFSGYIITHFIFIGPELYYVAFDLCAYYVHYLVTHKVV